MKDISTIEPKQKSTPSQKRNLTGKELILASKQFAKEKRSLSWFHTFSTLSYLIAAFGAGFFSPHWALKLGFGVIFGLLIVRFFIIYHDYLHGAILQKSALAKAIMTGFGIFVLAPVNVWKRTHDHHHQNNAKLTNSGIGSYPLLTKAKFKRLSSQQKKIYLAARHPLTIFLGYLSLFIFDLNIKTFLQSPKNHWDSLVALFLHVAVAVALWFAGGWETLLLCWVFPFMLADGLGAYLFYVQHNFPGATFKEGREWDYSYAALHSTSYLKTNGVMNWFTGSIGYHHVHHINHRIPFYRLKEAMAAMPELQHPKTTSFHPKEILAALKLKVWDPELNKMTPL